MLETALTRLSEETKGTHRPGRGGAERAGIGAERGVGGAERGGSGADRGVSRLWRPGAAPLGERQRRTARM
jgi:hypothetical protein